METTSAILLRKIKLTETSLIVTWLTQEHGKLKTVAKGARQTRSRFAGVLDLFYQCEIQFARSRTSELHVLREASLREPFEALRFDYSRTALAGYFVELLELVTEPEHSSPELYDLLLRALGHLQVQPASRRAMLHFEAELVRLLGIAQPAQQPSTTLADAYHALPVGRRPLLERLS